MLEEISRRQMLRRHKKALKEMSPEDINSWNCNTSKINCRGQSVGSNKDVSDTSKETSDASSELGLNVLTVKTTEMSTALVPVLNRK